MSKHVQLSTPAVEIPTTVVQTQRAAPAHAQHTKPTHTTPDSFLQRNSLRISGYLNLIGDVGLLAGGIVKRNPHHIAGGALYTLGAGNLARYGKADTAHVKQTLAKDMAGFFSAHAAAIPQTSTLHQAAHEGANGGIFARLDQQLRAQPVQNTMGLYTAGALAMLGSGVQTYRANGKFSGIAYGASSLAFKLGTLMLPEDTKNSAFNPTEKKGVIGWLKEKPLRLFGYGSLVTDTLLAWQSYDEYKEAKAKGKAKGSSAYIYTGIAAASYIVSDILMAMSYKDPANAAGALRHEDATEMLRMAAEVIAAQPAEKRPALTAKLATFLSEKPAFASHAEAIHTQLQEALSATVNRTWSARVAAEEGVAAQR
jgi:hypothetical protein